MSVNRFETILSGKGQVDGYYKYNEKDEVTSVGLNIKQYAEWEITEAEYNELLYQAITHHQAVVNARKHKAPADN
jgi:hypothetical protein